MLVRSHAVGICHSDFELYAGRYIIPVRYPIIPGHEWAGEIVEAGADVRGLKVGDRVVGECVVGPEGRDHFGFSISGANAEYFRARGEWLHVLPDELTYEAGALVEPFSVAYNATHSAGGLDPADQVAVIGGGPIGLLCVAAAAAHNATVTLIEPQQSRRAAALDLGARQALDPTAGDFADAVAEHTHGRGFDVVLEAAGKPAAMASALELAAHSARLVYIGIAIGTTAPAQLGLIQSKALRITGIIGSAGPVAADDPLPGQRGGRPDGDRDRAVPARRRAGRARRRPGHRPQRQGPHPDGSRMTRSRLTGESG